MTVTRIAVDFGFHRVVDDGFVAETGGVHVILMREIQQIVADELVVAADVSRAAARGPLRMRVARENIRNERRIGLQSIARPDPEPSILLQHVGIRMDFRRSAGNVVLSREISHALPVGDQNAAHDRNSEPSPCSSQPFASGISRWQQRSSSAETDPSSLRQSTMASLQHSACEQLVAHNLIRPGNDIPSIQDKWHGTLPLC